MQRCTRELLLLKKVFFTVRLYAIRTANTLLKANLEEDEKENNESKMKTGET